MWSPLVIQTSPLHDSGGRCLSVQMADIGANGSINMWSTENAGGVLDRDAEIELWTRAGHIKVKVGKGADIRRIDSLLAWAVFSSH